MYSSLVALNVLSEKGYTDYRNAMTPILETFGGEFSYDFKVSETLKSKKGLQLNRVFVISFKDEKSHEEFFKDEDYLKVKEQFFVSSVGDVDIISSFQLD